MLNKYSDSDSDSDSELILLIFSVTLNVKKHRE